MRFDRITIDSRMMNGQPCLRNQRLTVRRVVEIAAIYPDPAERSAEFPELDAEDFRQALLFSASRLPDEVRVLTVGKMVA